jgi:hypothetical protein
MKRPFLWKIPIDAPPDKLWRHIADTNRTNQFAGLPEFTRAVIDRAYRRASRFETETNSLLFSPPRRKPQPGRTSPLQI